MGPTFSLFSSFLTIFSIPSLWQPLPLPLALLHLLPQSQWPRPCTHGFSSYSSNVPGSSYVIPCCQRFSIKKGDEDGASMLATSFRKWCFTAAHIPFSPKVHFRLQYCAYRLPNVFINELAFSDINLNFKVLTTNYIPSKISEQMKIIYYNPTKQSCQNNISVTDEQPNFDVILCYMVFFLIWGLPQWNMGPHRCYSSAALVTYPLIH